MVILFYLVLSDIIWRKLFGMRICLKWLFRLACFFNRFIIAIEFYILDRNCKYVYIFVVSNDQNSFKKTIVDFYFNETKRNVIKNPALDVVDQMYYFVLKDRIDLRNKFDEETGGFTGDFVFEDI